MSFIKHPVRVTHVKTMDIALTMETSIIVSVQMALMEITVK